MVEVIPCKKGNALTKIMQCQGAELTIGKENSYNRCVQTGCILAILLDAARLESTILSFAYVCILV